MGTPIDRPARAADAAVFVMEMQRLDGWAHESKKKKKNLNHEFSLVSYSSAVWSRVSLCGFDTSMFWCGRWCYRERLVRAYL